MDYLHDTLRLARQRADSLLQEVYSHGFTIAEVCQALTLTGGITVLNLGVVLHVPFLM